MTWVYSPTSPYSQEPADSNSAPASAEGSEPSAMSSETDTPKASSCQESGGGELDDAPIHDDVTTFDGRPYRGLVDIVSGGFPCQDLSFAGKRAGIIEGKRSGLWREYARIVDEVGARGVLVENVPGLLADGALGVVLGDLADLGFDAEWWRLSAADVGAPHLRQRVFVVAYRKSESPRPDADVFRWDKSEIDQYRSLERRAQLRDEQEREPRSLGGNVADADSARLSRPVREKLRRISKKARASKGSQLGRASSKDRGNWTTEPNVGRVAHGVAFRVDHLRLCGNGVVPSQSVPAWALVKKILGQNK